MGRPAPVGVTEPKVDEVQVVYLMEKEEAAHSYWVGSTLSHSHPST